MEDPEQLSDSHLIERCLDGGNGTWHLLHDQHHQTLGSIISSLLRDDRFDSHLVEDLAQTVWLTLLRNDYEVLRRYKRERSCLNTYLGDIGKQTIELHYRVKGRRLQAAALEDQDRAAQFAEFQASLTPQENRFLHEKVLKDAPETKEAPMSAANEWVLKHRMRRKAATAPGIHSPNRPAIVSPLAASIGSSGGEFATLPGPVGELARRPKR